MRAVGFALDATPPMRHALSAMRFLVLLTLLSLTVPARARVRCTLDGLLAPGRYGVGHRQLMLVDPTRPTDAWGGRPSLSSRTLPTEVWYRIFLKCV